MTSCQFHRSAAAAGVSRQAVYLHFPDRADLMLALVRHADEKRGSENEIRRVRQAPDALRALREIVALQACMNPSIRAAARAVDAVRRTDEAVECGWSARRYEKHVTVLLLTGLTEP